MISTGRRLAQKFTTGSSNVSLFSVDLKIDSDFPPEDSDDITVTLNEKASGGEPGNKRYDLTNPSNVTSPGVRNFAAPANSTLDANTDYYIVIKSNDGYRRIEGTNSNDQDTDSGWGIADTHYYHNGSWNESNGGTAVRISINGPETPDAPTGLTLSLIHI